MTSDQQAFLAQKDQADGKKTLRAYYWKICGQEYDQEHVVMVNPLRGPRKF